MGCFYSKDNIYKKQTNYGTIIDLSNNELDELRQVTELYNLIYNNLIDKLNNNINFIRAQTFYIQLKNLYVESEYVSFIKYKYINLAKVKIIKIQKRYNFLLSIEL